MTDIINKTFAATQATPDRFANWVAKVKLAFALRRERNCLAMLSDDELRDIGISREDADQEAARKFWDIN